MTALAKLIVLGICLCASPSLSFAGQPLQLQDELDLRPWVNNDAIEGRDTEESSTVALPGTLRPTRYRLFLRPILENGTFEAPGEVNITLQCVQPTSIITFNVRNISVNHAQVRVWDITSNAQVVVNGYREDTAGQIYIAFLDRTLAVGSIYILYVSFTSPIPATPLAGLYRSSYVNPETGETHYLATTQFQRDDARRAFPCFDEPGIRSIFEISLGRRESFKAMSNMPLVYTSPAGPELEGWVWDHFAPTVLMPSYLIAVIVSDFENVTAPLNEMNGKPSRVWGAPYRMEDNAGIYGAVTSARSILAFEDLFSVGYYLPKLDSAAIPDFAAGAMENWGMVTYRENLLLYVNGTNTESERRSISSVISHELAHQWFGNTVTCATWAGIWLNEGFATYMSYLGMEATDPEYEPLDWVVPDSYQRGMVFDETSGSFPVYNDGTNPTRIVYQKAGSIIRMMSFILTEPTFIRGLSNYLRRHLYQSVVQDQLFQALTEAGHEDGTLNPQLTMKEIMDTWTYQSGFPLIRVNRLSSTYLDFQQESYGPVQRRINESALNPNEFWNVPLTLRSASFSEDAASFWMYKNSTFTTFGPLDTSQWVLVNPEAAGYYRVLYDSFLAARLQEQLSAEMSVIPATSRSQILDDYFKFAFATPNYTSVSRALDWTLYMSNETSLYPWLSFFDNLGTSFNYFSTNQAFNEFKRYFGGRISNSLTLLGEEQPAGERGNPVILRARLLDWNCAFGDAACVNYARRLYSDWVATPAVNPIPADLRAVMYCAIVAHQGNGLDGYNFALIKYREAEAGTTDQTNWLNAIACAASNFGLEQLLDLTVANGTEFTRVQQLNFLVRAVRNPDSWQAVLEFVLDRFDDLLGAHGATGFSTVVSTLSGYLSQEDSLVLLRTFIETNLDALGPVLSDLQQSLSAIERNIHWFESYGTEMMTWISVH